MVRRTLAALALLLSLPAALSPAAAAEARVLRYYVWLGGAPIFELALDYRLEEARYALGLRGRLIGLPAAFYALELEADAAGSLGDGAPRPLRYRLEMRDDGKPEWLRLDYDAEGQPARTTEPPLGDEGRAALAAERLRGTLDPLSAILALALQDGASPCVGKATIYDGRRRFTVSLTSQGRRTLRPSAYSVYAGEAEACLARLTPEGGFRRSGRDLEAFPRSLTLLFARSPAEGAGPGVLLPVRVESDSSLGALIIHLIAIEEGAP